jgi:hypothetical protein
MDIHIFNVPVASTDQQLEDTVGPALRKLGTTEYVLAKVKNKRFGTLYIKEASTAQLFLERFNCNLWIRGQQQPLAFQKSYKQDSGETTRRNKIQNELNEAIWFEMAQKKAPRS